MVYRKKRKSEKVGRIRLVIFDVDGTLVNAYAAVARSVNFLMDTLGLPHVRKKDIIAAVGWGEHHLLAQFIPAASLDKAVALYRLHHADSLRRNSSLLPGARHLLKSLKKKGCILAIASNRSMRFTRLLLRILGIAGYFDCILCRDKVANPKPHPEILLKIMRRLHISRQETIFVGDMTVDIEAGKRAGVRTVAVTTGSSSRRSLKALKPWRIIHALDQVLSLFDEDIVR